MTLNITQLLNKKGWTGKELGKLHIAMTMKAYEEKLSGKTGKPLISENRFDKMVSTITSPREGAIYNDYIALHEWIAKFSNYIEIERLQLQTAVNTFVQAITLAKASEEHNSYIEKLPVILTEKQYKNIKKKRIEEIIYSDGEEVTFNIPALIEYGITEYINNLRKYPRRKNPFKALEKKYKKELVTDNYILEQYNQVMGGGYYTLEDGTRSDKVSAEEWKKKLYPSQEEEQDNNLKRIVDQSKRIYEGMTEEEASQAQIEEDIREGKRNKAEWHYYSEPPKDLNKWEILETGSLNEFYSFMIEEDLDTEEQIRQFKAFNSQYKEVTDIILKDLSQIISGIDKLTIEEIVRANHRIGWSELYKKNIFGFKDMLEKNTTIFDGNRRAVFNGVAILNEPSFSSSQIDEEGNYKEPEISKTSLLFETSLYSFTKEHDSYISNIEAMEENLEVVQRGLKRCNRFNDLIDLIANVYEVEEIKIIKVNLDKLYFKIESYNNFLSLLYAGLTRTPTHTERKKELLELKLKALKDVFPMIEIEGHGLDSSTKDKALKLLENGEAFTSQYETLVNIVLGSEV